MRVHVSVPCLISTQIKVVWISFFVLKFQNENGKDGIYTERFIRLSSRQSHAVERELVKRD